MPFALLPAFVLPLSDRFGSDFMSIPQAQPAILVLGIGNTLLSDEGAGVHAMRRLQRECGELPGVDFIDGGTLSFTLAAPIAAAECLIVIDAAELRDDPGAVRLFLDEEMDLYLGNSRKRSVHEVGLLDLMAVACLTDGLPQRRALIGIQPHHVAWGDEPSAAVAAALPAACAMARELIREWRQ